MTATHELALVGQQRLELIGKYAKELMQGYVNGYVDEAKFSLQALEKLQAARILWRPDERAQLCLRPAIGELITNLTQDERRRQIHADVAEHLDHIDIRVSSLRAARNKGDYVAAEFHMQLLTERVYDMTGQFSDAIESLWYRLNSEFGFVSSLDDKIREIGLAQKQLRRLLDGFTLIDFNELIKLCGADTALRSLLVTRLQATVSQLSGSLFEVQKRLVDLMSRFRQQAEKAQLVNRMAAYLRQHPNFVIGDYALRSQVPSLINQAAAIKPTAAPALDRAQDNHLLANIAASIRLDKSPGTEHQMQSDQFVMADMAIAQSQKRQLKLDVENYFIQVIEAAEPLSALAYLKDGELSWDKEAWLFQVIAEYEGMPAADRSSFSLNKIGKAFSIYNQLNVIEDIHMTTRFFDQTM